MPRMGKACLVWTACLLCLIFSAPRLGASESVIREIEVRPLGRGVSFVVGTTQATSLKFSSFELKDPARLVIDIEGAVLAAGVATEHTVGRAGIERLRAGQFSREPKKVVRLVCDLAGGGTTPEWRAVHFEGQKQTRLDFPSGGAMELGMPAVEQAGRNVLLRLRGASGMLRRSGALEKPARVYLDLADVVVGETKAQECNVGKIRRIRMGQQAEEGGRPVARVVVEFSEEQAYTIYREGVDLIVAAGRNRWELPLGEYEPRGALQGKQIVIDPGHGGKDTGAPASAGPPHKPPYEKDIVLDIAQRLAKLAEAEGAKVAMTRKDDVYIELKARAKLANDLKADALVSVHCDSCPKPNTLSGTSVYYDHEHSRGFAQIVQEEMVAGLGTKDRGIRNANFAVIRRAEGPGVLVETAYMNNAADRKRLEDPEFRERAARAMLQGVMRFVRVK